MRKLVITLSLLCITSMVFAQGKRRAQAGGTTPPQWPTDSKSWINSSPYTVAGLKGKVAIFYFYEEG